jgi:TPR repeat protein
MEAAMAAMAKGETPKVTLQQAIDKIRELADKDNDKDALFSMGFLSQQSQGQNALAEAMTFYKRAADLGQLQAMNNYGFILASSSQEVEKVKEGLDFIKKASDGGLNAARRNMAAIYINGLGGEKRNPEEAEKLLGQAAEEKDGQAMFELAQFYLELGGEEKVDDDKAWEWLNKSADMGNPNALATLGSVLFDGKDFGARKIEADPKAAVEKFTKLAEQNVPAGLRTMAELHASGEAGVEKDFTKALDYFGRAAQGNDAAAQVILAGYYDRGVDLDPKDEKIDVAPNAAAALELYRLAARNNVPLALYNVGVFYEEGLLPERCRHPARSHRRRRMVLPRRLGRSSRERSQPRCHGRIRSRRNRGGQHPREGRLRALPSGRASAPGQRRDAFRVPPASRQPSLPRCARRRRSRSRARLRDRLQVFQAGR